MSITLKKSTKDRRTISQIRLRLPGTFKHIVALLIHKKLLKNLSMRGNSARIQNILHLGFTEAISLRVESIIRSIDNTNRRLNLI